MTNIRAIGKEWRALGVGIATIVALGLFSSNINRRPFLARESAAVTLLVEIVNQQELIRSQHGCFATDIDQFSGVTAGDRDYVYALKPTEGERDCTSAYIVTASPRAKGSRYFAMDQNKILRFEAAHPAGSDSPILQ